MIVDEINKIQSAYNQWFYDYKQQDFFLKWALVNMLFGIKVEGIMALAESDYC
jgi:hypothetical protein